jgi:hypothetical protein
MEQGHNSGKVSARKPAVAPFSKKEWCEEFVQKYRDYCGSLNIQLAEDCPLFDKAFSASHYGKVLGVWFNTLDLTWSYPPEKGRENFVRGKQVPQWLTC